jgi:transcriptional regulator with XRE-family HTH domain
MNGSGMVRRSLGRRLRALREASGKSVDDVRNIGSRNKIWRMETGKGPYRFADVQSLCIVYGADRDTLEQLTELALKTSGDTVYEDYADVVPTWFATYFELESAASVISTYQPDLVPGLLQTPDYARAVFAAVRPVVPDDTIERLVTSRSKRQASVLGRGARGRINAVVSEGVLQREVGGPRVASGQLAMLRKQNSGDRVRVRVLTFDSGAHAAMEGSFSLLEFTDPEEPPIAYQENRAGARYLERPAQVQGYQEMYDAIVKQSVPLEEYPT